jgi:hypothetical protein
LNSFKDNSYNRNQSSGNGWNRGMNSNEGGAWSGYGGSVGYNGWYNQSQWGNDSAGGYDRSNQNWAADSFGSGYQQSYSGGPARTNYNPRQQQYGNRKFISNLN